MDYSKFEDLIAHEEQDDVEAEANKEYPFINDLRRQADVFLSRENDSEALYKAVEIHGEVLRRLLEYCGVEDHASLPEDRRLCAVRSHMGQAECWRRMKEWRRAVESATKALALTNQRSKEAAEALYLRCEAHANSCVVGGIRQAKSDAQAALDIYKRLGDVDSARACLGIQMRLKMAAINS